MTIEFFIHFYLNSQLQVDLLEMCREKKPILSVYTGKLGSQLYTTVNIFKQVLAQDVPDCKTTNFVLKKCMESNIILPRYTYPKP